MEFNFKPLLFSKCSISILLRLSIFMIGVLALSYNTFRIFKTDGDSMSETYHHGENLLSKDTIDLILVGGDISILSVYSPNSMIRS